MIDSEYNIDTYKSGKVNIGTVMENSEMSKFDPDHLKTKKKCKHVVKKLRFLIRYDP